MMLSVTKRTSSKVKFWLFENFLSPTFKVSARAMAKRIGCEVEFVTYKWPEWLRGQSEKQRIIWGYKILFLDVLFPLSVKKIIYVDADQGKRRPRSVKKCNAGVLSLTLCLTLFSFVNSATCRS